MLDKSIETNLISLQTCSPCKCN